MMVVSCFRAGLVCAEDRTFDGTGNNMFLTDVGVAGAQLLRGGFPGALGGATGRGLYNEEYEDGKGVMLTEFSPDSRPNPRDVSNLISAQSGNIFNSRGLSDFIWAWGQFLDHDITLSTSRAGAATNGSVPIPIHDPGDPLFPSTEIAFTRHDFVLDNCTDASPGCRQQLNEVTSFIDGSGIYGSDSVRAAALRTNGGTGAKLLMGAGDLLPFNNSDLEMQNPFGAPTDPGLFLAGDIRANENVMLTSMHTLFNREHNRLVDKINTLPLGGTLNEDEKYQLARKIVGAELQIITYNEFLPALLGAGNSPAAADYNYGVWTDNATATTSFSVAAFRFGHSAVSPNLQLVDTDGSHSGSLSLASAFFNPSILSGDPSTLDKLLKGAASQVSQEIDTKVVDELRNMLFVPPGPSGAIGLDLAAINIHRGRDHGLTDYNGLRFFYDLTTLNSMDDITTDSDLVQSLNTLYSHFTVVDGWVGGLAEDHLPGSSMGELFSWILVNQFKAYRDGDRLFYLSDDLGLYSGETLLQSINDIIDLDALTLADVIKDNTAITSIQDNVFFAQIESDFNGNLLIDGADLIRWQQGNGTDAGTGNVALHSEGNANGDQFIDGADQVIWEGQYGGLSPLVGPAAAVPEPTTVVFVLSAVCLFAGVATITKRYERSSPYLISTCTVQRWHYPRER